MPHRDFELYVKDPGVAAAFKAVWEGSANGFPIATYPFDTGCLPLSYSGDPGVNGVSHRGANGKRLGCVDRRS